MSRYFYPHLNDTPTPSQNNAPTVQLDTEQSHHAASVMRTQPGEHVILFDGRGRIAAAVVTDLSDNLTLRITRITQHPRSTPHLTVCAAVPKGQRLDQLVNQLAQIGADRLVPLQTQRSVVTPRPEKLARMQRVATEAAKQSQHPYLLQIDRLATLDDALQEPADARLFCDTPQPQPNPNEPTDTPNQTPTHLTHADTAHLFIGPEGGWTDRERDLAREAGCTTWQINTGVLRVETAAAAAAAIARYLTQPPAHTPPEPHV